MKIVKNLFLSIVLIVFLIWVYMDYNNIFNFLYDLLSAKDEIIVKPFNEYKRSYDYIKFSSYENFLPNNKEDLLNIIYNVLNNGWDDFTFYCPTEYISCVDDIRNISEDKNAMSNINGYLNPFNSFSIVNTTVSNNREIYLKITKKYSDEEIVQINKRLDELENALKIKELSTKEEKLKVFHDYLIDNIVYDEEFADTKKSDYKSNKALGALLEGHAVCAGYSDSLALFLDRLNVPNIILASDTHAWNLVYIDDYWLHIDATWNDTENALYDSQFYLINTEELLKLDTVEHNFPKDYFKEAAN